MHGVDLFRPDLIAVVSVKHARKEQDTFLQLVRSQTSCSAVTCSVTTTKEIGYSLFSPNIVYPYGGI